MTDIQDIDPYAPGLNARDRAMLMALIKAREDYCLQGRGREYHAVGKALRIVWHYLHDDAGQPELPATDFGALDMMLPLADVGIRPIPTLSRSYAVTQWNLRPDEPR